MKSAYVLDVELERVRAALGARPEERARRRGLVGGEVEQQLAHGVAEVGLEEVASPGDAVVEGARPLVEQELHHRVQRLQLPQASNTQHTGLNDTLADILGHVLLLKQLRASDAEN